MILQRKIKAELKLHNFVDYLCDDYRKSPCLVHKNKGPYWLIHKNMHSQYRNGAKMLGDPCCILVLCSLYCLFHFIRHLYHPLDKLGFSGSSN